MKRVFKTRYFNRQMKSLDDSALCAAVEEMMQGLIDADLGGYIVKKRVALPGRGKSGGARTIVATKKGKRWFFIFGFAKNDKANITASELERLQSFASDLLSLSDKLLDEVVKEGKLVEICHEQNCEDCEK
jgi:hypothetical protein